LVLALFDFQALRTNFGTHFIFYKLRHWVPLLIFNQLTKLDWILKKKPCPAWTSVTKYCGSQQFVQNSWHWIGHKKSHKILTLDVGWAAVTLDGPDEVVFDTWRRVTCGDVLSLKFYLFEFIYGNCGFCQFFVYYLTFVWCYVICVPEHISYVALFSKLFLLLTFNLTDGNLIELTCPPLEISNITTLYWRLQCGRKEWNSARCRLGYQLNCRLCDFWAGLLITLNDDLDLRGRLYVLSPSYKCTI